MSWKLFYLLMRMTPTRLGQRTLWWALRKSGIAAHLCDEGYWKLQLLGVMTFTSDANIAITRPFSFSQAMLRQALG